MASSYKGIIADCLSVEKSSSLLLAANTRKHKRCCSRLLTLRTEFNSLASDHKLCDCIL